MERFQLTKTAEKYKQKLKHASTANLTTSWMRVFCQWKQRGNHLRNTDLLASDTLDSIPRHLS